jgi:REP element-mobilizing transposase RayT
MAQSLAKLHLHMVFCTRQRQPWLDDGVRADLHAFVAETLASAGCRATAIASVEDHLHVLFELSRTMAVCYAVESVKSASSRWLRSQGGALAGFAWQTGSGVFSVSALEVPHLVASLARQREFHLETDFHSEYCALLTRHQIAFDERLLWD